MRATEPSAGPARIAFVAILGCCAPFVAPALAREEPVPTELEGVGIDQRLDAQLPLDLSFVDEDGKHVTVRDYFADGRPVLLNLVYYECPMLCSLVLNGLVASLREVDLEPGEDFHIVSVSIDPTESPTLARSKKQSYVRTYGKEGAAEGWRFLTGEREAIAELADSVGFRYRYLEDEDEYAHGAVTFVVTPEGRTSRYLFGVKHDPRTMRLSLVEAAEGKIGSPLDKILLYCYRYDSEEGRYAPVAMRIMRAGGAATALVVGVFLVGYWRREAAHKRVA
ncbi:MAG: SCO family protein [bacterium]|nr:SCO family protein [bacterium]